MAECHERQNESSKYFTLPGPIRGLKFDIGGINVMSCILEKINRLRNYAHYSDIDEKDDHKKSSSVSLLDLILNALSNFKGSRSRESRPKPNFLGRERISSEHSFKTEKYSEDQKPALKRSCTEGCLHKHHAHISTWKHAIHVDHSHVPTRLKEPYIDHGYLLPFMPWRYYLKALYTPSYELMNVWTHLIPCIYFIYLLISFSQEICLRTAWPLLAITLCAVFVTGFSAMAHIFHSRSSLHHSCWFMFDYFGITLYAFATTLCNFYTGALLKYYKMLSGYYLSISILMCCGGFFCLCLTQTGTRWASLNISRKMKVYVNGFGYCFGALPLCQRIHENAVQGIEEVALWYHVMAMICFTASPIIYGSDFPQRLWPGKFNVIGHSHQLFHIAIAMAAYFDIHAIYYDVSEGPWKVLHKQEDYPVIEDIFMYFGLLIVYSIVSGCFIRHVIKRDFANEEPLLNGEVLCSCGLPETALHQSILERGADIDNLSDTVDKDE